MQLASLPLSLLTKYLAMLRSNASGRDNSSSRATGSTNTALKYCQQYTGEQLDEKIKPAGRIDATFAPLHAMQGVPF